MFEEGHEIKEFEKTLFFSNKHNPTTEDEQNGQLLVLEADGSVQIRSAAYVLDLQRSGIYLPWCRQPSRRSALQLDAESIKTVVDYLQNALLEPNKNPAVAILRAELKTRANWG